MRIDLATDPVYAPNSYGGPEADPSRVMSDNTWSYGIDAEMVRTAYVERPDDDDWSQAGALVRDVFDDAQRDEFVQNVAGHLADGVSPKVLERAFTYWRNVDADIGDRIADAVG